MKNFKFILGFAIFGFLLSFAAGLFSRSGAGRVFLHALIFAAVFFCLALGIQFLFSRFFSAEQDSFAAEQPARAQGAAGSGHVVDIVIQDEELPSEENAPGFFVGSSHNMLNANDMNVPARSGAAGISEAAPAESGRGAEEAAEPPAVPPAAEEEFVPVRLAGDAPHGSGPEAAQEAEARPAPSAPPPSASGGGADELDVLPDLEGIEGIAAAPEFGNDDSGGGEASPGREMVGSAAGIQDGTDGKDAALMAKAISTLLAGER